MLVYVGHRRVVAERDRRDALLRRHLDVAGATGSRSSTGTPSTPRSTTRRSSSTCSASASRATWVDRVSRTSSARTRRYARCGCGKSSTPCPPPGASDRGDAERLAAAETMLAMQDEALPQFRVDASPVGHRTDGGPSADGSGVQVAVPPPPSPGCRPMPTGSSTATWHRSTPTSGGLCSCSSGGAGRERWQLKSPTHSLFLDVFAAEFPEARFVMTHRERAQGPALGRRPLLHADEHGLRRGGPPRRRPAEHGPVGRGAGPDARLPCRARRRVPIAFAAIQEDPFPEVRRLYDWSGRELTPETEAWMRALGV